MSENLLAGSFSHVVLKRLTAVEADPARSNQHEFNGVSALRSMFGDAEKKAIPAEFIWAPDEAAILIERGFVSWYDARARHPTRSEFRLYYAGNAVTSRARDGDLLMIGKRRTDRVAILIAPAAGEASRRLLSMAGIDMLPPSGFVRVDLTGGTIAALQGVAEPSLQRYDNWVAVPEMTQALHHAEAIRSQNAALQLALSGLCDEAGASWDDVEIQWVR